MSAVVFCGPTVSREVVEEHVSARCLPPAAQGDLHRAVQAGHEWIAIIDGYFHRVPAVWHKEILWALTQGVRVYGAASMGALRAAELSCFGMCGIGRIYAAYATGAVEDDDEVAVLHGPAESGYLRISEAMVNIRFTLEDARARGVIGDSFFSRFIDIAKRTHYTRRSWRRLFEDARRSEIPESTIAALEAWVAGNALDQKQRDAVELLKRMARDIARSPSGVREEVNFVFEPTILWHDACREGEIRREVTGTTLTVEESIVDELRLDPRLYEDVIDGILLRHLVTRASEREGQRPSESNPSLEPDLMSPLGLVSDGAIEAWIRTNETSRDRLHAITQKEVLLRTYRQRMRRILESQIPDLLRARGLFAGIAHRAAEKSKLLEGRDPGLTTVPLPDELIRWHLSRLEQSAATLALVQRCLRGEAAEYLRAVAREYTYQRLTELSDQRAVDVKGAGC